VLTGRLERTLFDVFEFDASTSTEASASLLDTLYKPWIVFKSVVEPVVLRLESDQHASGFAVACDNDILCLGFPKKARQVVFHLGKGHFLHFGLPNRASHDSASGLGTIANTSTVEPETS
jgi:hypothetical protein